MGNKQFHSSGHLYYSRTCHVIFCPKYRRGVFSDGMARRLKQVFTGVAASHGFSIAEMEVMPDHVHLLVDCNPRFGICKCVGLLKGTSSGTMRNEFSELRHMKSLWTRGSFISSVGSVSLDVVKQYIENQKKEA